jgi:lysophospholipase L1-like esterase
MLIDDEDGKFSQKSIVDFGNTARISKAMKKAAVEKRLTVGCIGGSITQGAFASSLDKNYVSLISQWWQKKYPDANIKCINAGIGATGSVLSIHRIQEDLLQYEPDFVVVEYAVNEFDDSDTTKRCYESLIRRILTSKNKPGVMLMFLTTNNGTNFQDMHKNIGYHYNLPMVSFRDAIWPEFAEGRIKWEDLIADSIHPNDDGHYLIAKFITDRLDEIYKSINTFSDNHIYDIKEPILNDSYKNASILNSDLIKPVSMGNWRPETDTLIFKSGWVSSGGYNPIVFEVESKNIGIIYKRFNTKDMGRAELRIDDLPPKFLEGYFDVYWGGFAYGEIFAEGLSEGKHRLEVKLCEDSSSDRKGTEFMICGLMAS